MKKHLSFTMLTLAIIIIFAIAAPAISYAAPSGFIGGAVAKSDKNGYNNFAGKEITANNSSTAFEKFTFFADNKILKAWYIDVADDISGTLDAAYKIGGNYYIVTFDIDGAGKYWIADSSGANGANMVKIGAFVETVVQDPIPEPEITIVRVELLPTLGYGYATPLSFDMYCDAFDPKMTYEEFSEKFDPNSHYIFWWRVMIEETYSNGTSVLISSDEYMLSDPWNFKLDNPTNNYTYNISMYNDSYNGGATRLYNIELNSYLDDASGDLHSHGASASIADFEILS